MKRLFSITFLSLLLVFLCGLSSNAKTQADRTLTVYVQTSVSGGQISFSSPSSTSLSLTNTKFGIVTMEDYLYIGGVLLEFSLNGVSASQVTIVCNDANYVKTVTMQNNRVREFIPLSSAKSSSVYLTFK